MHCIILCLHCVMCSSILGAKLHTDPSEIVPLYTVANLEQEIVKYRNGNLMQTLIRGVTKLLPVEVTFLYSSSSTVQVVQFTLSVASFSK